MKLQKITPRKISRTPPEPEGWEAFWHGYFQQTKVRSAEKRSRDGKQHSEPVHTERRPASMGEIEVERQILLNIIMDIDKDVISMFELGAGRGDWCLSLAGVVDHKLIDCTARKVKCLAVEGEPTHYKWTQEHFDAQGIDGVAVHGAVHSHNGICRFSIDEDPASSYGQSIKQDGEIEVPAYTVDTLAARYGFDHIDIFHVDVQGAEVHALLGARRTILDGSPSYFLIGTHGAKLNRQIRFLLSPLYEVLMDHPPWAGIVETPFGAANLPVDGIMVLERRQNVSQFQRRMFQFRLGLLRLALSVFGG